MLEYLLYITACQKSIQNLVREPVNHVISKQKGNVIIADGQDKKRHKYLCLQNLDTRINHMIFVQFCLFLILHKNVNLKYKKNQYKKCSTLKCQGIVSWSFKALTSKLRRF